jgi:hypothetical protein
LADNILSLDDYNKLRDDYMSRNKNLCIFEITAPTSFGSSLVYEHLKILVPDLIKPSKILYPNYSREYDFLLDNQIRIEVKASRAVDKSSKAKLYAKALNSSSNKPFVMNFQQKKPQYCDVFVWIAVWLDIIRYWVFHPKRLKLIKNIRLSSIETAEVKGNYT